MKKKSGVSYRGELTTPEIDGDMQEKACSWIMKGV